MTNQEQFHQLKSSQPVIHRGRWLLTGSTFKGGITAGMVLEDGALLVADGVIQEVGKYSNLSREFGQYPTRDHEGRVLAPALINGHCHLELSFLDLAGRERGQKNRNGDFTAWIRALLAAKEKMLQEPAISAEIILNRARETLQQMHNHGVAFVGDVGNSQASRAIGAGQNTRVCFLLELLGLTKDSETKTLTRLEHLAGDGSLNIGFAAHAPYSTSPTLIRTIKEQADKRGYIFSIHVAESAQEVEFLRSGTGSFKNFLLERDAWDGTFSIPAQGSVQYLENLGVIDHKTLCVHGVHVNRSEIEILAQKGAKVCLCPGSNRYLGVGKAPVTEFLVHGILPALGTDSSASNRKLHMWREMRLLREDHPDLAPESVFAMATRGGAEAWGVVGEIGSLAPGKQAYILAIGDDGKVQTSSDVFEHLTTVGESVQTYWLE
jgi:cytosine/adenosine deaminase-related metal-dependent hydrolase